MSNLLPKLSFAKEIRIDNSEPMKKALLTLEEVQQTLKSAAKSSYNEELDLGKEDVLELVNLYNKVIIDGRYLKEFSENPKDVAEKLKVQISDSAIKNFHIAANVALTNQVVEGRWAGVIISIAICLIIAPYLLNARFNGNEQVIIDESGIIKL